MSEFDSPELTPTDDPKLKVEWMKDGVPLRHGSRFKVFHDFSFVILEINSVNESDAGVYTARATNDYGEAVISCTLTVSGKSGLISESQLSRLGLNYDKLAQLEGVGAAETAAQREEEDTGRPPELTQLSDIETLEGALAHFECRLTPTNDPKTTIQWFHNGKPISHGSRIKTISGDFGFVILEIGQVSQRDAGVLDSNSYNEKFINQHY